jgi:hypothetical protein
MEYARHPTGVMNSAASPCGEPAGRPGIELSATHYLIAGLAAVPWVLLIVMLV